MDECFQHSTKQFVCYSYSKQNYRYLYIQLISALLYKQLLISITSGIYKSQQSNYHATGHQRTLDWQHGFRSHGKDPMLKGQFQYIEMSSI